MSTSFVITNMNGNLRNRLADAAVMVIIALLLMVVLFPRALFAAQLDVAVWIPWWQAEMGAESAEDNIRDIDILYPFTYEVQSDGTIKNRVDFDDDHWDDLFDKARDRDVRIIPSVMWFDGEAIHAHLSDRRARNRHIDHIVKMVEDGNFDGVNIDYEEKWSETKDDFSRFLRDLKDELEDEVGRGTLLTCTVEARMRPEHRWRPADMPSTIRYANDYKAMNRYCDRVEIMTYDQQRADLHFNDIRRGVPYAPVADTDWVEHVLEFALEDFDEDKVYLGVATYGRAWDITVAPDWYRDYERVATLNQPRILELAEKYNVPIGRTEGDEAVISYFPDDSPWRVFNALPKPEGTPKGFEAAAKALMVATYANIEVPVRIVFWSDAHAIEEKMELAKEYDLAGVAIFKVDGEEDPDIWKVL